VIRRSPERTIDRIAIAIVGVILGGLLLFFLRLLAGSWRELAAALSAVAVLVLVAFVGDRALRKHGDNVVNRYGLLWTVPAAALLGAIAGGVYALVSANYSGARPAAMGAWTMALWTILSAIWNKRPRRQTRRPHASEPGNVA
jgi:hypothetical protein